MKRCPQCATEYEDNVSFCTKDGRSLVARGGIRTKLCPHCANSIAEDALKCPYCKADLSAAATPEWPTREDDIPEARSRPKKQKTSIASKVILVAGVLVFGIGVFLIGGERQRTESQSLIDEKLAQLNEKEQKIQALETELANVRKDLSQNSTQQTQLKNRLEESQRNLASTQQKLSRATRDNEKLLAQNKAAAAARAAPRQPEPSAQASRSGPAQSMAELGVYQTVRTTSVYQEPSASSKVLSQINKGTRVNVVRSLGDWLEVRSKRNNPTGFVRRDDMTFVARAN